MAWRLARSLVVLRNEVRALHPGTTVWDIGDADHADSWSDHNPNQCCDVVCATDTLGNAGLSLSWYAEKVRQAGLKGHPALKYVIFNRRIASRGSGFGWRTYSGSNPHTTHVHVSVGIGPDGRSIGPYDSTQPWGLIEEGDEDMPYSDWPQADREALQNDVAKAVHTRDVERVADGAMIDAASHWRWSNENANQAELYSQEAVTLLNTVSAKLDEIRALLDADPGS